MTTTVTTSTNWFSRLGNSLKNIFVGVILIIGAPILLFWNEGRAVKTEQSLKEGLSVVVSVNPSTIDKNNEGKLVHFSGRTTVPSVLADGEFGVSGESLIMKRVVEVYQWKEETKSKTVEKLGGGTETTTTYTYSKGWHDSLIDSSSFREAETHQNPTDAVFSSKTWVAEGVMVGSYPINEKMLSSLSGYTKLPITQEMLNAQNTTTPAALTLAGSTIYYQTKDVAAPEIGNIRIYYEIITPQDISVVYKQSGAALVPYITKNGSEIKMIQLGRASAQEMFKNAVESNNMMTWILRVVGAILMYIGFQLVLSVLPTLGSVIPFVGNIIGAGVGIVSFFLTVILSSIVIAVAWITYRPLIGITLIIVAVGGYILLIQRTKK